MAVVILNATNMQIYQQKGNEIKILKCLVAKIK